MLLTAQTTFELTGLWVQANLLGAEVPLDYSGITCRIVFPTVEGVLPNGSAVSNPDSSGLIGLQHDANGALLSAEVRRVRVDVDVPNSIEDPTDRTSSRDPDLRLPDAASRGRRVALEVMSRVTTWARADRQQFWLEPESDPGQTSVSDPEERSSFGMIVATINESRNSTSISRDGIAALFSDTTVAPPALADTLIADAQFYAVRSPHPDPTLGVLLAAISTEVRIRQLLSDRASEDQKDLVDLIVDNPRDVSIAAVGLFDRPLKAVTGVSLKEANKELYKRLISLFEQRNKVAHRAAQVDVNTASTLIQAALEVASWLADLRGIGRQPPAP